MLEMGVEPGHLLGYVAAFGKEGRFAGQHLGRDLRRLGENLAEALLQTFAVPCRQGGSFGLDVAQHAAERGQTGADVFGYDGAFVTAHRVKPIGGPVQGRTEGAFGLGVRRGNRGPDVGRHQGDEIASRQGVGYTQPAGCVTDGGHAVGQRIPVRSAGGDRDGALDRTACDAGPQHAEHGRLKALPFPRDPDRDVELLPVDGGQLDTDGVSAQDGRSAAESCH